MSYYIWWNSITSQTLSYTLRNKSLTRPWFLWPRNRCASLDLSGLRFVAAAKGEAVPGSWRSKLRTSCRSAKDCQDKSQQHHATAEHQIRSEARLVSSRDCKHNLTRYLTKSKDCECLEHKKNKYNRYDHKYLSSSALPSLFALLQRPLLMGRKNR